MLEVQMEKYLVDNSAKLEKILKQFTSIFKEVDKLKKAYVTMDFSNVAQGKDVATKLTGYFMEINDVHKKLVALKKNKYHAYYYSKKIECQTSGEKFVDGATKEEANLYIADERRVVAIFEGKASSCLEGIRTCKACFAQNANLVEEEK